MWNSIPRRLDRRARVSNDGLCSAASSLAIAGCFIPSMRASAVCVSSCSTRYSTMRAATARATAVRSHSARKTGSSSWCSSTSSLLRMSLSFITFSSSRFDLREACGCGPYRSCELSWIDIRFRSDCGHHEYVSDLSVEASPAAPPSTRSQLAQPGRSLHLALMRKGQRRSQRLQLLDRVQHRHSLGRGEAIELGFCFGVEREGPHPGTITELL